MFWYWRVWGSAERARGQWRGVEAGGVWGKFPDHSGRWAALRVALVGGKRKIVQHKLPETDNKYIWEIWSYLGVGGMCGFESRSGNESKQQFGRQKKPRELCSLSSHRRLCPSRILNHLADERTNLERNGSEPTRQRIITRSLAIARGWLCPGGRNFLGAGKLAGCVWGTLAWSFPRLPEFGSRRTLTLSTFAVCQPRRPTRLWMEVRRA